MEEHCVRMAAQSRPGVCTGCVQTYIFVHIIFWYGTFEELDDPFEDFPLVCRRTFERTVEAVLMDLLLDILVKQQLGWRIRQVLDLLHVLAMEVNQSRVIHFGKMDR